MFHFGLSILVAEQKCRLNIIPNKPMVILLFITYLLSNLFMINDNKIKTWMTMLGSLSTVIHDARLREDWPSDDESDVVSIINEISDILDILKAEDKLSRLESVDDATLLGVLAMFSFPRAVRLIQLIGERSSSKLTNVLSKRLVTDDQSEKYLTILYARIVYLSKTQLLSKLFSSQRFSEIATGIQAQALAEKNLNQRNTNDES